MAQFTLKWNNASLVSSTNCTNVRASYRLKSAGGAYTTTGFAPPNDLDKALTEVDSPVLSDNVVYQFKIEALCSENGPTPNDNGIVEALNFSCITPSFIKTDTTVEVTVDLTNLDITKVRLTLRLASNNVVVGVPVIVNKVGNSAVHNFTGLTELTNYYVEVELYATVGTSEIVSSAADQLAAPCSPYPVKTDATPVCDPITSATVTSIEIA